MPRCLSLPIHWINCRQALVLAQVAAEGVAIGVARSEIGFFDAARLQLYCASFCLSVMAGLAYQLRTGNATCYACVSSMLNSGLVGLSVTLFGLSLDVLSAESLLGLSILFGLGGTPAIEKLLHGTFTVLLQMIAGMASKKPKDGEGNP